jgi:hypothetical protein
MLPSNSGASHQPRRDLFIGQPVPSCDLPLPFLLSDHACRLRTGTSADPHQRLISTTKRPRRGEHAFTRAIFAGVTSFTSDAKGANLRVCSRLTRFASGSRPGKKERMSGTESLSADDGFEAKLDRLTRWLAGQADRADRTPGTLPKRTSRHHSQSIENRHRPLRKDNWWPGIVGDRRCPDQMWYTLDNRCTMPHRNWHTCSPGIGYKTTPQSLPRCCHRDRLDTDQIHPQRTRRDNRADIHPLEVRSQVDIAGLEREPWPERIG